jgi:hypothetical protein
LWYALHTYQGKIDFAVGLAIVASAAWMWRRGILRLHPAAWYFLPLGAAVYFAMPLVMMRSWGADLRLPAAILLLAIGFVSWRLGGANVRRAFLIGVCSLTIVRIAVVEVAWRELTGISSDIRESTARLEPGSKVIVGRTPSAWWAAAMGHVPCIVIIERSGLCALEFSDPLQQILVVKPPYRAITGGYSDEAIPLADLLSPPSASIAAPNGRIYWSRWTEDYDYLYLLTAEPNDDPAPEWLHAVYKGRGFQLFRIRHAGASQ